MKSIKRYMYLPRGTIIGLLTASTSAVVSTCSNVSGNRAHVAGPSSDHAKANAASCLTQSARGRLACELYHQETLWKTSRGQLSRLVTVGSNSLDYLRFD